MAAKSFVKSIGQSSIVRYTIGVSAILGASTVYSEVKDSRAINAGAVTLLLDLEKAKLVEEKAANGGGLLKALTSGFGGEKSIVVADAAAALRLAGNDVRIAGLLVNMPNSGNVIPKAAYAPYQELRNSFVAFTAAKREARTSAAADKTTRSGTPDTLPPVSTAWAASFGEFGNGTAAYYLATGCDTILMQPSGLLSIVGFGTQATFVRELLDKLKIKPTVIAREEYKNALNTFTERDYTRAHADALRSFLESVHGEVVAGISAAREVRPWRVRQLINTAPLNAQKCIKAGLIDGALYRDEVLAMYQSAPISEGTTNASLEPKAEDESAKPSKPPPMMSLQRYMRIRKSEDAREDFVRWVRSGFAAADDAGRVVVVTLAGQIRAGTKSDDRWAKNTIWSRDAAETLRSLREKKSTKAVVLKVNSPGGSALGSDEVRREVEMLRMAGIPVVVSMGSLAASGGYMISCCANTIVAQPTTLTGSIGVLFGKFNIEDFLGQYGISSKSISIGDNATITSSTEPLSRRQLRQLNAYVDEIYNDFIGVVAHGRKMSARQVRRVAKGRIWSGSEALKNGLVDELGGIDVAIARAKELAVKENPDSSSLESLKVVEHKVSPLAKLLAGDVGGAGIAADIVIDAISTSVLDALVAHLRSHVLAEIGIVSGGEGARAHVSPQTKFT